MTIDLSQKEVDRVLDARIEERYGVDKIDRFMGWLDEQAEADKAAPAA